MHALAQKLFPACVLFAAALSPVLHAQDATVEDGPPNVLVIHREYLKPGKGGMVHDRSESAFVHAFADAKSPYHYFAMDSLSGVSRSLFFFAYDSFADWEKETAAIGSNKALAAKVDQATLMDGDLLSGYDAAAMLHRPDLSLNSGSIDGARYFEITVFVVKPGHMHDFAELTHLYIDAYKKIAPESHWDTFEVMYGSPLPTAAGGGVYLVFNLMKSLAETDKSIQDSDKFSTELGAAAMQKVSELTAASVEATTTNLFVINPRESNPPAGWIKKDPGFWKPQ
jgi:hypothetical protein